MSIRYPQRISVGGVALLAFWIIVFGYIATELWRLLIPPMITIDLAARSVATSSSVVISGRVRDAITFYEGERQIFFDAKTGAFSEAVSLQPGVNIVTFTARDRLGKTRVVTRTIEYRPEK